MVSTNTQPEAIESAGSPVDQRRLATVQKESKSHQKVLRSLKKLRVPGYGILVEEKGGRLDLPNERFREERKGEAQRKQSLCYADAIIHAERVPRVLIEVVDKSPTGPNGITGLTVNVDRIARFHPNIDLVFVVLAEMKEFYCSKHHAGHRLTNTNTFNCFCSGVGVNPDNELFWKLVHGGKEGNFKKALFDYPISNYLCNTSPPAVLFLNATRVATAWETYESDALRIIGNEIAHVISSGKRSQTRFTNLRELIPESITFPLETYEPVRSQSVPPPGTEVTWKTPERTITVVIKNRGLYNTRVRFPDGRTEKVPNTQLDWQFL